MSLKGHAALFLIVGVLIDRIASAFGNVRELNVTGHSYEDIPSLAVAKFDFERVAGPLVILVWILIASLAKLGNFKKSCGLLFCLLHFIPAVFNL